MNETIQLPAVDAEGYLIEPLEWTEEVAAELARQENIELNDDHWMSCALCGTITPSIRSR